MMDIPNEPPNENVKVLIDATDKQIRDHYTRLTHINIVKTKELTNSMGILGPPGALYMKGLMWERVKANAM